MYLTLNDVAPVKELRREASSSKWLWLKKYDFRKWDGCTVPSAFPKSNAF
jgi:hypothetical protein